MAALTLTTLLAALLLLFSNVASANYVTGQKYTPWKSHGLRLGFYKKSCPQAEDIVNSIMLQYIKSDKSLAASILRLHFHDCFVRGCDGSLLLNSTASNTSEINAPINTGIRGFFVIDTIKIAVEKACPQIVSCADILALAARDGVVAIGGPFWDVPTGRRDGKESHYVEAQDNTPKAFSNISELIALFKSKGLNKIDLVALSGAHTIGRAHCVPFNNRLYNFTGKGDSDPSLDATYLAQLKTLCAPGDLTTKIPMGRTPDLFDLDYFIGIKQNRGLFTSDVDLLDTRSTKSFVDAYATNLPLWYDQFRHSMVKMGLIDLLTGTAGEIRKDCKLVN